MDPSRQREILGLALFAFGALVLLSLLRVTPGVFSDRTGQFLSGLLGWGAFVIPLMAFVASGHLLRRGGSKPSPVSWGRILAAEVLFAVLLALAHLMTPAESGGVLAENGGGGGFVGWAISGGLASIVGNAGAALILILAGLFVLPAVVGLSNARLSEWGDQLQARVLLNGALRRADRPRREWSRPSTPAPETMVKPIPGAQPVLPETAAWEEEEPDAEEIATESQDGESATETAPDFVPAAPPITTSAPPVLAGGFRPSNALPSLDLLDSASEAKYGEANATSRASKIEETLANFGVPAKVIEINAGPTVTQFGLEPGFVERRAGEPPRKVSVNRIAALQHDLELALAAAPIRIETPVPGRPVVGLEVPNQSVEMVSLRGVLESDQFRKKKGRLKIALGRDVSGTPAVADLASMPHLLIAGATGSGKSVCINTIIACLLFSNSPDSLRLIMVDPKRVELAPFNNIPHLLGPVIVDVRQVVPCLQWITGEMDNRFAEFAKIRVRNIEAYNEKVAKTGGATMPYIVTLIDELADLMLAAPDDTEKYLTRLAQMARATGIHLVIATQRPSVDVVTGLIKANFPARISFAVTSSVDSRVVLDTPGAEKLLGRGDMLYMASDSSKLLRLQGCFISDEEIARLVNFWRKENEDNPREAVQEPPWKDLAETPKKNGDEDLINRAIELVEQYDRTSVSFLQRKLEIGFPRAARLMDQLEERGIVGPDEGGGKSRTVLTHVDVKAESEPDAGSD